MEGAAAVLPPPATAAFGTFGAAPAWLSFLASICSKLEASASAVAFVVGSLPLQVSGKPSKERSPAQQGASQPRITKHVGYPTRETDFLCAVYFAILCLDPGSYVLAPCFYRGMKQAFVSIVSSYVGYCIASVLRRDGYDVVGSIRAEGAEIERSRKPAPQRMLVRLCPSPYSYSVAVSDLACALAYKYHSLTSTPHCCERTWGRLELRRPTRRPRHVVTAYLW